MSGPGDVSGPQDEDGREVSVEDERAADDRDEGWGGASEGGRDDDWYRAERPPHWD